MLPKNIQILLFSATFPERVLVYAERYAPNANQMKLRQQELTVKGISQMYMDCPDETAKYDILCKLYGLMTIGSSVIFVKVSRYTWDFIVARPLTMNRLERAPTKSSVGWRQTDTKSLSCMVLMKAPAEMHSSMTSELENPRF
jgi:hypothetical protein